VGKNIGLERYTVIFYHLLYS